MMKTKLYIFLFSLLSLLSCLSVLGVENVQLHKIGFSKHLAKEASIIVDPEHKLTYKDIYIGDTDSIQPFQTKDDVPYMDFTASTYWMKLKLTNDSNKLQSYYIELARPLTNVVNLYIINQRGKLIDSYQAGDKLPFKQRPYSHRNFIFPVDFPAHTTYTLIAETKSDGEILKLPFKFWNVEAFTQHVSTENFFLGLYYGLFILVFVLFSFFGFALKEAIYLYFVVYVFFLGLFQLSLDGLAYQYLWPSNPWFGNHAILILAATSMFLMLLYVKKFLNFRANHQGYLKVYHAFMALVLLALITSSTNGFLYQYSFPVLNALSFISILYILYGLFLKFRSDDKPDLAVLMAFIALTVGAILFISANTNFIPNEFLAANALKLGSAAEVLFLSLAMASRYRQTQLEKIEAQEIAFARLEEVNTLKEEQNIKLEQQVKERTEEILIQKDQLFEQNREIINSINYAKRLQDAILPSDSDMNESLPDSSILFKPKDIVSGDFYWLETTEERVFFAVADCTGHGVPGALVSVVGYNALNRCVRELKLEDPAEILEKLRELVIETFTKENTDVKDGMDIALCVWDRKSKLKFAGAYNPLYLLRNEGIIEIKGDKQPIGKFAHQKSFHTHEIDLQKGDLIYLFSDGYADQFGGPKGKKLKYANFKKYLISLRESNGQAHTQQLAKQFEDWLGAEEQIDDVCVLKVKF